MANPKVLKIEIRDTETIIFTGEVDRISSFNEIGRFDVFPMHANFISIIHKELSLYHNKQKIKEISIEEAVIKVKQDMVSIYLGIETLYLDDQHAKI